MDYLLFISSLFFLAFSLCFSPGPNNTMCMAMAMSHGFRYVFPYSAGVVVGAMFTFALTAFGLGEIFQRHPTLFLGLRIAGGAYLVWLALMIAGLNPLAFLRRGGKTGRDSAKSAHGDARPLTFLQGCAFQLINVKVWMGHVITIGTYAGADEYMWHRIVIIGLMTNLFGGMANLAWAAGGVAMNRFLSSEGIRRANYLFAASLVLSVILLFFQ